MCLKLYGLLKQVVFHKFVWSLLKYFLSFSLKEKHLQHLFFFYFEVFVTFSEALQSVMKNIESTCLCGHWNKRIKRKFP